MRDSGPVSNFRDLKVWQHGIDLVESVNQLTKEFPREELYGLTSQLRRAAASIPANIAEGHARESTKEYLRFLSIAIGSLSEVETFVEVALRLQLGNPKIARSLLTQLSEERRMLRGLQRSLKSRQSLPPTP